MRTVTKAQALEQFRYNWKCDTKGTKMATDSIAKLSVCHGHTILMHFAKKVTSP